MDHSKADQLAKIRDYAYAISIIAYPIMLFIGFVSHPNILAMEPLFTVDQLVARFHNNPMYHIGHLLVTFTVPVLIIYFIGTMNRLKNEGRSYGFWGGIIGVFGAFILAVDKGALCLVLSAFDTLPEADFQQMAQYLSVIVDKKGYLVIVWLIFALMIGGSIQIAGLLKEKVIEKWQGYMIIIGLLLLINPDIELISSIGAGLMCIAYIPWGLREFRQVRKKYSPDGK